MKKLIFLLAFGLILCLHSASQGSAWQREVPDSTGFSKGAYCSLALDSENNPHIAYFDYDFWDLRYASYDDGTWTVTVVDSLKTIPVGRFSIALDSGNRPHISYQGKILGYYYVLKYAMLTDTGWCKVVVDSSMEHANLDECGKYSSIAIDQNGYPCISYANSYYPSSSCIKYAFEDGNGWHIRDVKSGDAWFTKLVFDNGNTPIIGFHEADSLRVAFMNATDSSWSFVVLPDSVPQYTPLDFDIDSENNLYFAYSSESDNSVRLAVYDGQSWNLETVPEPPHSFPPTYPRSLKIDQADQPSLVLMGFSSESGNLNLYFCRKVGGEWTYSLVDDVYPPALHSSLKFDSDNFPRIAAQCWIDQNRLGLFYYCYWPGSPQIALPQTFHNYGAVWTQSSSDWDCPVENQGTAPLIINELDFITYWPGEPPYQIVNTPLPKTILPQESDNITIRFKPLEEQTYLDTLIIYSNDSLHPAEKIALQGTGTSSGTVGDLTVDVKDCYAALEYNQLNENSPLIRAEISLYQGSQLRYGPTETDQSGSATLQNVTVGNYDLKVAKEASLPGEPPQLETLGYSTPIEIGPGMNSRTIVLPESLMVQKYQSVYDLTHIEKGSLLDNYSYTFSYPSEGEIKNLLDSWQSDLPPNRKLSVARLLLAEQMVDQMFGSGYSMGGVVMRSISELINFIFYSDTWFDSILDILKFLWHLFTDRVASLMDIVNAFAKNLLLSLMDDAVQQAAAELPCLENPYLGQVICGDEVVMAAWGDIKARYSGWRALLPGFSSDSWAEMHELIEKKLKDVLFQVVYVDLLTDAQLDKAQKYSENFQFNGSFEDASACATGFIAVKRHEVEREKGICDGLIVSAELFMATAALLNAVGSISVVPGASTLDAIGDALKIGAYVQVVSAIGISAYTFFTLPGYMDEAVDRIYYPQGLLKGFRKIPYPFPRAKSNPQLIALMKQNLQQSTEDFDSVLVRIKDRIVAGETEDALLGLEDLMNAENNLRNGLKVSCAPIYAVANIAKDSLESFPTMYDSLISSYADAGMERLKDYIWVMFLPADTSQVMKERIIAQLDRSAQLNQILTDQITATLDTVSNLPMPAIVAVSEAGQDLYKLSSGEMATIHIKLQNVGALAAEGVSVLLRTSPAIGVNEADSIYVGALSPGEESQIFTWTVSLLNYGYSRGIWTVEIHSSNAKTYSYSGSFETPANPETPGTGGKLCNANVYCYPNPFNPDKGLTNLRYSLAKTAQVAIEIYDAGGNLVKTLQDNVSQTAGEEQSVPWDGRNGAGDLVANGVYFFVIETSQGERAVGKIAVLR